MSSESVLTESSLVVDGISSDFSGCRCNLEVSPEVLKALKQTDQRLSEKDIFPIPTQQ